MKSILVVPLFVSCFAYAAELEAVPSTSAVSAERMTVRKLYSDVVDRSARAHYIVTQVPIAETPVRRYAMLVEARELAKQIGDLELMLQIADVMGQYFVVDVTAEKVTAVTGKLPKTVEELQDQAKRLAQLSVEAEQAEKFDTAKKAAVLAANAYGRLRDTGKQTELASRASKLTVLDREWTALARYRNALVQDPEDADANLQVGLYYCLHRNNWQRGLAHMAKGANRLPEPELVLAIDMSRELPAAPDARLLEMAKTARLDLTNPRDADTQAKLGDAWVAISKIYTGDNRQRLLDRAGRWYADAITQLRGIERLLLETRVAAVPNIGWYGIPGKTVKAFQLRSCRSSALRFWTYVSDPRDPEYKEELIWYTYWCSRTMQGLCLQYKLGCGLYGGSSSFDESAQTITLTYSINTCDRGPIVGSVTKTFCVGLKNGRLYFYNCYENGVRTDETALEYWYDVPAPPPIDISK